MKHEVIISSSDYEEFQLLKKLKDDCCVVVRNRAVFGYASFVDYKSYSIPNKALKNEFMEIINNSTDNSCLENMSVREFRTLRKRLKNK